MGEIWYNSTFRETAAIVLGALALLTLFAYLLRNKGPQAKAALASLVSWLVALPILFVFMGLPSPWQLFSLTLVAIFSAKVFFQITGFYHRSYFVLATYIGQIFLALAIYYQVRDAYNVAPMAFLGAICLIPIFRNSAKQMIQYIALTSIAFIFLGWAFMHLGWIWTLEGGPLMVIYITILTEVCDNLYLGISRKIGKIRLFSKITPKRSLEAWVISAVLTMTLAWGLRHLLPVRSEQFWIASGIVASVGGGLGDLVLSVIRRDLGIKDVGAFIIGRGDFLAVMDRMIFVATIFYYTMWYLEVAAK